MTMDTSIKENHKKKWSDDETKGLFKNGTKYSKNGNSFSTTLTSANGNNCSDKETVYKNEIIECTEDKMNCGLGPCSPKWLQVCNKIISNVNFCLFHVKKKKITVLLSLTMQGPKRDTYC